jgi:hypothetical protein
MQERDDVVLDLLRDLLRLGLINPHLTPPRRRGTQKRCNDQPPHRDRRGKPQPDGDRPPAEVADTT